MSLSRTASPTIGSEKKPCQSSVDNWLKITVELTCVRSSITSRRSRPSVWSKIFTPQSSRIRSLMFFNSRMRRLYEPSPLAMDISVRSLGILLKRTLKPFLQAALPRAHPRKVLSESVAPVISTFRLSWIQVQDDSCITVCLFTDLSGMNTNSSMAQLYFIPALLTRLARRISAGQSTRCPLTG